VLRDIFTVGIDQHVDVGENQLTTP
jgi:hypothetical protein